MTPKSLFSTLILVITLLGPLTAQRNTLVMGSMANIGLVREIEMQVDQRYLNGRIDHYRSNILEDGSFAFAVEINEPQIATLAYSYNKALIYLEPGDTLIINAEADEFQYSLEFSGRGAYHNTVFKDFLESHPPNLNPLELLQYRKGIHWFSNSIRMDQRMQDYGVGQFTGELRLQREKAMANLEFYAQNYPGHLSNVFIQFLRAEIQAYWAYHLMLYGMVYKNVHQIDEASFFTFLEKLDWHSEQIGSYWHRQLLLAYINYLDLKKESDVANPYLRQHDLAKQYFRDKTLAFLQSEMIQLAFQAKYLDEALSIYSPFLEKNNSNRFDEKVVRAFQKAMRYAVGTDAPNFLAKDIDGQPISLSDYGGRVVFLNFWASWCRPCMDKMREMKSLQEQLRDQGIVFVNISLDRRREAWQKAIERNGFVGEHILLKGETNAEIARNYEVKALPEYFIIDKTGNFAEKPVIYDVEALRLLLERLNRG